MGQMRIQRWMRLVRNLRRDSTTFRVTPSGLEKGRNVTVARSGAGVSTENPDRERTEAVGNCNECNEALEAARKALTVARRLGMIADNAIANGDVIRARAALRDLQEAAAGSEAGRLRRYPAVGSESV